MVRHGHPTQRSNVRTFTRSNDIGRPGQAGIPAGVGGVPGTYTELYSMQEEEDRMTWEEFKNQIDAWLEEHGYEVNIKIGYIDIDIMGDGLKIEVMPSYDSDVYWLQVLDSSEKLTINLPAGEFRYGEPIIIPDGVADLESPTIIGEEVRDENDQV